MATPKRPTGDQRYRVDQSDRPVQTQLLYPSLRKGNQIRKCLAQRCPSEYLDPPHQLTPNLVKVFNAAGVEQAALPSILFDKSGSTGDNVTKLDNNVTLNGGGGPDRVFDLGLQIGKGGAADGGIPDFFSKVIFDISATGLNVMLCCLVLQA